jgi:nucleotide-binding universal stress UspA family protein
MKILVPVDGSAASLRALQFAIDQVKTHRADSLIVINVQNLSTLGLSDGAGVMPPSWIEQEEEKASRQVLEQARKLCAKSGVPHTLRAERGGIAATIARATQEEKADQIVMGTRGLGEIKGLLLGSIATQVLHLVDVPVTLVK